MQITHRIVAKAKKGDEKYNVGAIGDNGKGMTLLLERPYKDRPGVARIEFHLEDGTVVSSDEHWLNVYSADKR